MLRIMVIAATLLLPAIAGAQHPRGPHGNPGPHGTPTRFATVVFFGDSHTHLLPGGPRRPDLEATYGGFARAATYIAKQRHGNDELVVLHSGDFSVGDPIFNFLYGYPELALLARTGADAVAIGNHEFDLGPLTLLQVLTQTFGARPPFPLVSANLDLSAMPALGHYVRESKMLHAGGLRIGVFGMTTPDTELISLPSPVVVQPDIVTEAAVAAQTLHMQGADVVVMLSHLGVYYDYAVAQNVPGIDVVLGGHDHLVFTDPITITGPTGPVVYAHAGEFYRYAGCMRLRVDRQGVHVQKYELVPLDHRIKEDRRVRALVDMFAAAVAQYVPPMYTQVVAQATQLLEERVWDPTALGAHDTAVGDLVADAWKLRGGTDLAVQPGGSTAEPIYPGPIVPVDLFHVNGYGYNLVDGLGFHLVRFDVPGLVIAGGIEYGLGSIELSDDMLMQVSGNVQYAYDPALAPGSRLQWVTIDGVPLDPNRWYSVTANEFVLSFVEYLAPGVAQNVQDLNVTEFQALWDYVGVHGLVPQYPAGRVFAIDSTP